MAKFNAYVYLADEDGNMVIFKPDEEAPKWAVEKAGKHCFVKETEEELELPGPGMTQVDLQRQAAIDASRNSREAKAQAEAEAAASKRSGR